MSRDEAFMLDILLAAKDALAFVRGLDRESFDASTLHQNAVVRVLEIIGEAAKHVSQETQDAHPEIPWRETSGMRNKLIHEYFDVDLDEVWDTVKNDIPTLIALIEPLVPMERPESP